MNLIISYIQNNYPLLFIFIAIIVATWFVCWKWFKFYHRFKKTEEDCNKIAGLTKDVHSIRTDINRISSSIEKLFVFLNDKHDNFDSRLFRSQSPIQLTPAGSDLLSKFGGDIYIENSLNRLITLMEVQNFKSALDVQNHARVLLSDEVEKEDFVKIKNYIFNNPVYKYDDKDIQLNLLTIISVMSIYLRDKYFEKHPELREVE